ncbi:hypothetical protein T4D_11378 [Trichinella pseudospiralis]|uniref:Uncharacterized protein n=1 Tax=Trichinella pseudospiralis TaxID=6337 RepID=A0A0V1FZY1_TRIPS|nr:hypothetical protein T4D_11378 [Trichinella pseudospiralis]
MSIYGCVTIYKVQLDANLVVIRQTENYTAKGHERVPGTDFFSTTCAYNQKIRNQSDQSDVELIEQVMIKREEKKKQVSKRHISSRRVQ